MSSRSRRITFWFSRSIPDLLSEQLRPFATVQERSFSILEADQVDWRSCIEATRGTSLWDYLQGLSIAQRQDIDWRSPPGDVIGAVLGAADVQRAANRAGDYEPKLPPPDMGFLQERVPLEVLDEPEVDLSEVGEDLAYSTKLAQYLAAQCDGELGEVSHNGQVLAGFKRLFPRVRAPVLSELNRGQETPCRVCGAPLVPSLGVWVAATEPPEFPRPVVLDLLDLGHLGAQHRIVVDRETARVLEGTFGRGLVLEPVHGASSETARWAQTVVRTVREPV